MYIAPVSAAPPVRTSPVAPADRKLGPTPERYEYDIQLDPKRGEIQGNGSIAISNTTAEPLTELYLRLWPNAPRFREDGGAARVSDVTVDGAAVAAQQDGTVLRVPLATPLAPGQRAQLAFSTAISVPGIESRFGKPDANTLRIGNALPTLAVKDEEGWNLDPYVSGGEAFYDISSDWRVDLRLPTGWDVLSTGVATTQDAKDGVQHLRLDAPDVRDFAFAALRGYQMIETTVDGTRVRVASDKQVDDKRAKSLLQATADSVRFFNQRFGPYGAPELDVVASEDWGSSGMEYPGLVIDGTAVGAEGWRENVETAAHEAAHQWFYGIVGNNQFDASWLDESFAQFAAWEFMRTQRPDDAVRDPGPGKSNYRISSPRADAFGDKGGKYATAIYDHGARMLYSLRSELGEQRFDDALKQWVADNRHGIVTGPQFVQHMSSAAGRDLTDWFAQHGVRLNEPGALTKLDPNARHGAPE